MTNQGHVWQILDDVLLLLAGQYYPTPERTYKLDGGWSLALADLKRCFGDLRADLALVKAERDAARAEAEARTTIAARAQEALRYLMNGLPTNDAVWAAYGNADSARAWLADRDSQYQAALLAAQSGEARAVEALSLIRKELGTIAQGYEEEVRNEFTSGQSHGWGMAYLHAVQIIGGITDGPALAWLSQQLREAAAEALEEFADDAVCMEKLITCNIFDLRSALRTRAAAIRAGEVPHE